MSVTAHAEAGVREAEFALETCDTSRGRGLLQALADRGDPGAQWQLGEALLPTDRAAGERWFKTAFETRKRLAENGDIEALEWVGRALNTGGGTPIDEVAATALLPDEIEKLLAPLDERERQILALRFGLDRGEPRTLEEVGEYFNLTRERIRQIEARAMSKLRHPSADTGARDLLAV